MLRVLAVLITSKIGKWASLKSVVSEAIFEEFNEFDCSGSDNSSGSLFYIF